MERRKRAGDLYAVSTPCSGRAGMKDSMPAEVAYWQRQQQLVSEFGLYALACRDLDRLMAHATAVAAKGLDTPFAKVLQYRPAQGDLLVRAGVGWKPGVVGSATVEADLGSPAGFALKTGQPVVSSRLAH